MAIKVMADNQEIINVSQDAALYNVFASNNNFVIADIGNELIFNSNASSLEASLGSGEGVICGRHVTVTGTERITLPANSSGNIVLRYDKSQSGDNICKLIATTSSTVYSENLNDNGIINDLLIGQYTTNASGVVRYTDKRDIRSNIKAGEATTAETATEATRAVKLKTARNITLSGAISGSASFDGTADVMINTSIDSAPAILSGTVEPEATLGKDGDIFILYTS